MFQAEKGNLDVETPESDGDPVQQVAGRKRAAVELIRNHDTALRSSARRYSICSDDADDAYQRGIEILLSKAPTTDIRQLLPWTRTVIKHEALAIRRVRERTLGRPSSVSPGDDSEEWVNLIPSTSDGPDERAMKREKVARSREALAELKPQELKALTMLAEGYSYAEIGAINRWTRTKVNRCLAEGRQRFRAVFRESEVGERCAAFEPMISAACDGELEAGDLVELENHLAACGHCRATLRAYRAAPEAAAALLPAIPLARSLWDRLQESFISAQVKFQGLGRTSDSSVSSVAMGGGTRGAGAVALAKIATVCIGTAGGAAACVATGVLPVPQVAIDRDPRPAQVRTAESPTPALPAVPHPTDDLEPASGQSPNATPDQTKSDSSADRQDQSTASVPAATPTETEFTPESAGTPVTSTPPPSSTPAQSSSVPVGGGGGEFAP